MNKREFIRASGLIGLATMIPFKKSFSNAFISETGGCVLIPGETAGPFPLDLTANTAFFRQDIRENKAGVQLNLRLRIIGNGNCLPMENLRVNIWHCDKDGFYSGYSQTNNPGQAGLTYLRGYQITDANGEVEFITILPGWYSGRICHIHFQVYVSSSYAAISQLTFDLAAKNAIYSANSSIYTRGVDPLNYSQDNIFSDGYSLQLATLTPNANTGGYDSFLEVTIQGNGTTGIGHLEKENAKQVVLRQNFPNPYEAQTTIPFLLKFPSRVSIDLYDLQGRKVAELFNTDMDAGEHTIPFHPQELGLNSGNYAYQIEVRNKNGVFRDVKLMTAK